MVIKNLLLLLALNDSRDDDDGRPTGERAAPEKGLVKKLWPTARGKVAG
jgi:hypothetical protein